MRLQSSSTTYESPFAELIRTALGEAIGMSVIIPNVMLKPIWALIGGDHPSGS